jgi:uncharacterized protein (TIGR02147 family)
MKSIFDFENYKDYLEFFEKTRKNFEKGFRSKLAEHIGCQSGYISHVLNGNAHLSLEQTMKAASFLGLDKREQKYFLLLVEYARAGTPELKNHFKDELTRSREEFLNIKTRVGSSRELSEREQSVYYSHWQYVATHVLTSLPEYNDVKSIASALGISEQSVSKILLFLIQTGIVKDEKGKLKSGLTKVHLNRESPLIRQHHTNWRIAAIQSLPNEDKSDVHYSTVSTLSVKDAEFLRSKMVKLIEDYVETVGPSREEVMYCFNLDFFSVIKK